MTEPSDVAKAIDTARRLGDPIGVRIGQRVVLEGDAVSEVVSVPVSLGTRGTVVLVIGQVFAVAWDGVGGSYWYHGSLLAPGKIWVE